MSDIFQEVEEDLRRERLKRVWDRYGIYVIVAAVLVVVLTAGWRGYIAWDTARSRAAGERYAAALAEAGGPQSAALLQEMADEGPDGYALLARFRLAAEEADAGETAAAAERLQAIAADTGVDSLYRDLARVRRALILLDEGEIRAAQDAVIVLAERQDGPFTYAAQEVMGLAAWAEQDLETARSWFAPLEDNPAVPSGLRGRARLMLLLIDGQRPADTDAEADPATTDAADGDADGTNTDVMQ